MRSRPIEKPTEKPLDARVAASAKREAAAPRAGATHWEEAVKKARAVASPGCTDTAASGSSAADPGALDAEQARSCCLDPANCTDAYMCTCWLIISRHWSILPRLWSIPSRYLHRRR